MELALCMPMLLAVCGVVVTTLLCVYARFQMVSFTHDAVRGCVAVTGTSIGDVRNCVQNRLNNSLQNFTPVCSPIAPAAEVTPLNVVPVAAGAQIYLVSQQIYCTFTSQLGFLSLVPGPKPSFVTISARSASPFIPSR